MWGELRRYSRARAYVSTQGFHLITLQGDEKSLLRKTMDSAGVPQNDLQSLLTLPQEQFRNHRVDSLGRLITLPVSRALVQTTPALHLK
jgi:hypothetical protein